MFIIRLLSSLLFPGLTFQWCHRSFEHNSVHGDRWTQQLLQGGKMNIFDNFWAKPNRLTLQNNKKDEQLTMLRTENLSLKEKIVELSADIKDLMEVVKALKSKREVSFWTCFFKVYPNCVWTKRSEVCTWNLIRTQTMKSTTWNLIKTQKLFFTWRNRHVLIKRKEISRKKNSFQLYTNHVKIVISTNIHYLWKFSLIWK